MIIKGKKYRVANGLAFDLDADLQLLQKELAAGWELTGVFLWWFVFEKTVPTEGQYAVDYFDGDATELPDYLETYKLSGWHLVFSQKYYYIFKGDQAALPLYTDAESFKIRKSKELLRLFLQSLLLIPMGLGLFYVRDHLLADSGIINGILSLIGYFLVTFPVVLVLLMLIYKVIYKFRRKQLTQPAAQLTKRRRILELVIAVLLMAGLGFIVGYTFAMYF